MYIVVLELSTAFAKVLELIGTFNKEKARIGLSQSTVKFREDLLPPLRYTGRHSYNLNYRRGP